MELYLVLHILASEFAILNNFQDQYLRAGSLWNSIQALLQHASTEKHSKICELVILISNLILI